MTIRGEMMEKELREQPGVLRNQSPRYFTELVQALEGKSFDMVLLAARGSSDHAALYARYLIEIHLGIPVSLAAPSVITRYGSRIRYPKTLAVGISQSGAAPDVAEVISYMRSEGHTTLAITNTADSRLTEAAEITLLLEAGPEQSIAATKTYTASMIALYQLVRALGSKLPDPAGRLPGEDWLAECRREAERLFGPVVRCEPLFCLARGYSFCTAMEGALKLMECALLPAKAYSSADFAHGPRALADVGSAAIIYGEVPPEIKETGAIVVQAPRSGQGALEPVWEILFAQWLALLSARARGLDPDHAPNLRKITETL
jgi:glucosamine--fructose-6-phosphate aminotransferase (isomerizing)